MLVKKMNTIILGGGIAGLSLAHFLEGKSVILEKEKQIGGLCRSFEFNGIFYDWGPHIMFSKNEKILKFHTSLVETNRIKRSNKIYHKGRLIKYPFENDLSALDKSDRDYCLQEFINNPYENLEAKDMLQFFLKTFGKGITKLYLQPYNEKIWKFDPAMMDTQMVERIPKPPKEDVIKSAKGIATEGYTHQLFFYYPKKGGFQQLIDAYAKLIEGKSEIINPVEIKSIRKKGEVWNVETDKGIFNGKRLVNCMPIHELFRYIEAEKEVVEAVNNLKYNSIYVAVVQAKKDNVGNNFSINFADKEIIFHRFSKLNFLGKNYCLPDGGSTLLVEITYRRDSECIDTKNIKERVIEDLDRLNLVKREDVTAIELRDSKYAYVIYDLNHRKNIDFVLSYLLKMGIQSCGRFAEFEYLNTDVVAAHSMELAKNEKDEMP